MTVWAEQKSNDVECDKLQRIHTMENLAMMLEGGASEQGHTLRDDNLLEEVLM